MEAGDPLHLIAPQLDPHRLLVVGREDLDRVATHAEGAGLERGIVALVLNADQIGEDGIAPALLAHADAHHQGAVRGRVAEAVDRRDGGDDHHVLALHQRRRGTEPQRLEVLVDRGILLDVDVGRGDVGLGLVVVVVRDEVLDRIARQELLHLAVQLRGEGLVVREDERGLAVGRDGVGQGHRLATAGHAQQGLVLVATDEPRRQLGDGARLVAGRFKRGADLKSGHRGKITGFSGDVRGRGPRTEKG